MEDRCKYCGALEVNCAGQCLARTLIREFEDNERSVRESEKLRRERTYIEDCKLARTNILGVLGVETEVPEATSYDTTRRAVYFNVGGLEFQVIRPDGTVLVRSSSDPVRWSQVYNRLDIGKVLLGVKA
jgi:hypothetical protein